MSRNRKQSQKQEQAPATLGQQLRGDLAVARRRQEDAAQLAQALDIGQQLADQCDILLAEKAELEEKVASLEAELLLQVAEGAPVEPVEPVEDSGGSEVAGDPVGVS